MYFPTISSIFSYFVLFRVLALTLTHTQTFPRHTHTEFVKRTRAHLMFSLCMFNIFKEEVDATYKPSVSTAYDIRTQAGVPLS